MSTNEDTQKITRRLDMIIKLLLTYFDQDKKKKIQTTAVSLVKELNQLGFENSEIARLLGRSKTQISKLVYKSKNK